MIQNKHASKAEKLKKGYNLMVCNPFLKWNSAENDTPAHLINRDLNN